MTQHSIDRTRLLAGIQKLLLPTLGLSALVFIQVSQASALPGRIAVRWDWGGGPNASMSSWGSLMALSVFWLSSWSLLFRGSMTRERASFFSPSVLVYAFFGMLLGLQLILIQKNVGASSWSKANDLEWFDFVIVVVLVGFWSLVGYVTQGRLTENSRRTLSGASEDEASSPLGLRAKENAVVIAGARARLWFLLFPLVLIVLPLITLYRPFSSAIFIPAILLLALFALFAEVHVVVSRSGVTIHFGIWGWPRRRIAIESIEKAGVRDLFPREFGGWGYRRRGNAVAIIVRAGKALALKTSKGEVLVSLDEAEEAAGLINGFLSK